MLRHRYQRWKADDERSDPKKAAGPASGNPWMLASLMLAFLSHPQHAPRVVSFTPLES